MRQSTAAAYAGQGGNAKGLYRPASERYPLDPLSLPRFAGAVPGIINPRTESKKWAQLALRCFDTGIIKEEDEELSSEPSRLVAHTLKRWASEQCGVLNYLSSIEMILSVEADPLCQEEKFAEENPDKWYWGFDGDGSEVYTLKEKVTALDVSHPGLAETALHWLQQASWQTWDVLTPMEARGRAEHQWWYGESDEKSYIDMYEEMNGELPDSESAMSPSQFDQAFPENILKPEPVLDRQALDALVGIEGEVGIIARSILEVMDLLDRGVTFPDMSETENDSVYFAAVLQWEAHDPVMQLLDDWFHSANENSDCFSERIGIDAVDLDAKEFPAWKTQAENGLRLLGLVNSLVGLLGTPV